jgi:hypothetical protein
VTLPKFQLFSAKARVASVVTSGIVPPFGAGALRSSHAALITAAAVAVGPSDNSFDGILAKNVIAAALGRPSGHKAGVTLPSCATVTGPQFSGRPGNGHGVGPEGVATGADNAEAEGAGEALDGADVPVGGVVLPQATAANKHETTMIAVRRGCILECVIASHLTLVSTKGYARRVRGRAWRPSMYADRVARQRISPEQ